MAKGSRHHAPKWGIPKTLRNELWPEFETFVYSLKRTESESRVINRYYETVAPKFYEIEINVDVFYQILVC